MQLYTLYYRYYSHAFFNIISRFIIFMSTLILTNSEAFWRKAEIINGETPSLSSTMGVDDVYFISEILYICI